MTAQIQSTFDRQSGPWKVSKAYWSVKAEHSKLFVDCLTREIGLCRRNPIGIAEKPEFNHLLVRLAQCIAFGQHLERLPDDRQIFGQYGLYGTAAGLELLSDGEQASTFSNSLYNTTLTFDVKAWANSFLRAWNFFDLMINEVSVAPNSKFSFQRSMLLRICHVLRMVAAASPVLDAMSDSHKRSQADCNESVVQMLSSPLTRATSKQVANLCFDEILRAKVNSHQVPQAFRTVNAPTSETTFQFASASKDVPENWKDWLFIWSSVVIAVARSAREGLLSEDQVSQLISPSDIERIRAIVKDKTHYTDPKYRLFALLALDNLLEDRSSSHASSRNVGMGNLPDSIVQTAKVHAKWIETQVGEVCEEILRKEIFTDVHCPYKVYFSGTTPGERYWYDYYVVPVLPVMLDLIARHKPKWLFRPKVSELMQKCFDAVSNTQQSGFLGPEVIPFQVGNFNGTVNATYYVDAFNRIGFSLARAAQARVFFKVVRGYLKDNVKITLIIVSNAILVGLGLFFVINSSLDTLTKTGMAVVFGLAIVVEIVASTLASVFMSYLNRFR